MRDDEHQALFTTWLGEHGSSVMKVARAYTLTIDEAQDLAQEILLQAWRSIGLFEGKSRVATWFYRVALNTAMNWQRSDVPRRLRQKSFLKVEAIAADADAAPEQIAQREMVEALYAAIHQLPKADAALVLLSLEDLSYREIADVLGISENHVGVKLNRARKALAALMNGESHGP